MLKITKPTIDKSLYAYPITQGGSGAMTLAESAVNLELITNDKRGQANGPIPLDSNGRIDPAKLTLDAGTNSVNLQGTFIVVVNETLSWTITDYDAFKSYAVSASAGTISQSNGVVTYTAPGSVTAVTITVAGRSIPVSVLATAPQQPAITTPSNAASGIATNIQFVSNAFAYKGGADTHASSDWQLSTDSNFASVFASITASTTNKTTWTPGNLPLGTRLFARVRYRGASGNVGPWSAVTYFTTATP